DENVVWNTTNPDFTACFQKTVFVWVPFGILWLLTPFELCTLNNFKEKPLPWTGLNITKLVFSFLLMVTSILDMTHWLIDYVYTDGVPYANYNSPFIKAISYVIFLLIFIQKSRATTSSGLLFIFWFLTSITATLSFRTHITNALSSEKDENFLDFIFTVISYPIIISQLILSAFAESPSASPKSKQKKPSPETNSSFVSRLYFAWFDSMILKGFKKPLIIGDMWDLLPINQCEFVALVFNKYWERVKTKVGLKNATSKTVKNASIVRALWNTFKWPFMFAGFLRLIADSLALVNPLILQLLITFVSTPNEPSWRGYLYAFLLCGCSLLQSIIYGQQYLIMFNIAMRIRAAVISTIYQKALRISPAIRKTSTMGEIVNLMSVDAQRLMDLIPELHVMWTAFIQIGLALYLLWGQLGPSIMTGFAIMVIMIPINGFIAGRYKLLQINQMRNKDQRVKLMNEVLNGIKVLKLYAWERSFQQRIEECRGRELKVMKSAAYLNAVSSFVFSTVPLAVALGSFATYVLIDENNILDATRAFVSLSLFNIIQQTGSKNAFVSFNRMNKFLNSEELDFGTVSHDPAEHSIQMQNVSLAWDNESEPMLHDITLSVPAGSLVAIVGSVGTGKSSLLSGMLGDMVKRSGTINVNGTVAYVAQQAWIQNSSLRDNVLFGKPFNQFRYDQVIEACALKPDLQMLPGGDETEIGEKGINLSGGQKQRVSVARAVYFDSEIILLDDPLSAVDSHVGKHIFENVIGPEGVLKNKTRVLITNGITYLPQMHYIVVLDKGTIVEEGTYEQLVEARGPFSEFLMNYLKETEEDVLEEELSDLEDIAQDLLSRIGTPELERTISRKLSGIAKSGGSDASASSDAEKLRKKSDSQAPRIFHRTKSQGRISSARRQESKVLTPKEIQQKSGKLVHAEVLETGKVQWAVYIHYLRFIGLWVASLTGSSYVISSAFTVGSNIWLSIWSEDPVSLDGKQDIGLRDLRLGVYGGLGFGQASFVLFASYSLAVGCIKASKAVHGTMLSNVLRCPMSFFDTTPLGRILNRFSKDIDIVDTTIPMILRPLIGTFLQVISTIVIISISTPIFLIIAIPISILFYVVQRFYIFTSRQLKRLESITRSPIFSHFSETLSGASTIRAYSLENQFVSNFQQKVDTNHGCYYPSIIANRWLSIRLELLANLIILSAALLAVIGRDTLDAGTVGLSITYASSITNVLIFMVRMMSDLETNIVAVERIQEYSGSKVEAPEYKQDDQLLHEEWPQNGVIVFDNYSTRYRSGLDLVLNDINLLIRSKEKIGIVGRTGAGKSSLTLALFRLIEPANGVIRIDDADTFQLGLNRLRSKLTIIPQDPVLFSGSLRMNLDPFDKYSDDAVWKSLEQAHLKSFVMSLQDGLTYRVSEGGDNLSVGQRQLVCLARALLRKTKILILDEATASVDLETDDLIQTTIRKEFEDCTIITIAHRLNTIMDSTRVMVLERGQIQEFESPTILLQNKKSLFYSMAKDAEFILIRLYKILRKISFIHIINLFTETTTPSFWRHADQKATSTSVRTKSKPKNRCSIMATTDSETVQWIQAFLRLGMTAAAHPVEQIGYEPIPPRQTTTFFGKPALGLPGLLEYMGHIKKTDGFFGLYRGVTPRLCGSIVSGYVFSKVTESLEAEIQTDELDAASCTNEDKVMNFLQATVRDMSGRCMAIVASQPFHVITIRAIAQFVGRETLYNGFFSSLKEIYENEGFSGGLVPRLLAEITSLWISATLTFVINTYIVEDADFRGYTSASMAFIASAITYPLNLVSNIMAMNDSGLAAGMPPNMPIFFSWQDCWKSLSSQNQLKRGSSLLWRYYTGPYVSIGGKPTVVTLSDFVRPRPSVRPQSESNASSLFPSLPRVGIFSGL
uniref:ABC-type glutathione-S-conjugate transporter n=1 Tax=Strigamia maritima TaxID=126957 RepID=T1JBI7_STRMM